MDKDNEEQKKLKLVVLCGDDSEQELSDDDGIEKNQEMHTGACGNSLEQTSNILTSDASVNVLDLPYYRNFITPGPEEQIQSVVCNKKFIPWYEEDIKNIETNCNYKKIPQKNNNIYKDLTPLGYFELFFDQDMITFITEQTNLYSVQKTFNSIVASEQEIRTFIGMNILAGIIKLPNYRMYWSEYTRFPPISDAMSRKRFDKIRSNIHFNDNRQTKSRMDSNHDRLFKIRPFIEKLQKNFRKIDMEEYNCINEFVIPIKKRNSQYKPYRSGIKVFARYGAKGFMYDFQIYTGKSTTTQNTELGLAGDVVLEFCKHIPNNENFKIIAGQGFTSYELACELKKKGILFVGCVNPERLIECGFHGVSKSRGSFEYRTDRNENIFALKWYDEKPKYFISSYRGTRPMDTVKRWLMQERRCVDISRPAIVTEYDNYMSGAELHTTLVNSHGIHVDSKKMYINIFYTFIDVCIANAWILYKTQLEKIDEKSKVKTFIEFRAEVAHCLIWSGRSVPKKRLSEIDIPGSSSKKRSKSWNTEEEDGIAAALSNEEIHLNKNLMSIDDIRFDNVGHLPVHDKKRNRCKQCQNRNSSTRIKCIKCNVGLCLTINKDCFLKYHTKE